MYISKELIIIHTFLKVDSKEYYFYTKRKLGLIENRQKQDKNNTLINTKCNKKKENKDHQICSKKKKNI